MTFVPLGSAVSLPATHAAGYGHHPDQRPIVEVELAATTAEGILLGRSIRTSVLVDSGADVTMLDGGLAPALGLDLSLPAFPKGAVGGVGAGGVQVARADLKMEICGRWADVPVNFTLNPLGHVQLMGREGAFDAMLVAFLHGQYAMLASAV